MSATLSRRAFSAGFALGVPTALLGKTVASQSILDPYGTGMDLQSALLRVSPHYLRDLLVSTPLADGSAPERWADVGETPYFTSVGGVNVLRSGSDVVLGAYIVYLAPAGTRAGSYLGKRALESATSEILEREVAGYPAEVLVYADGEDRALAQVPIGNVMMLGYDVDEAGLATADVEQAAANAETLVTHLRDLFRVTR
jgi:hypothetical protein